MLGNDSPLKNELVNRQIGKASRGDFGAIPKDTYIFGDYIIMVSITLEFSNEEYEILKDGSRIYKEPIKELIKNTVLDSLEDRHEDESLYYPYIQ